MVLICTQNDKKIFFHFYVVYFASQDIYKKRKFSEMLIGTKFLDKKKE